MLENVNKRGKTMDRMRTFLLYALGIIGFIFLSYLLENGLISNMYKKMDGDVFSTSEIVIEDVSGRASNINGYMNFKLTNLSPYDNINQYIKLDLYSKQGLHAVTKYIEIADIPSQDSKNYQIKFKGSELRSYDIAVVSELPDMTNIINIFGWEIDLSDVFGLNLTDFRIMGVKLTDIFIWDNVKTAGQNAKAWSITMMKSVPWWGYVVATGLVAWYMPNGFLFGVFPF